MHNLYDPDGDFNSIRDYLLDAVEFLQKFLSEKYPDPKSFVTNDPKVLSMLWTEADKYDHIVLRMFESFREFIGEDISEINTSRGAIDNSDEETNIFYFHCTWELIHQGNPLLTVTLSTENNKFEPVFRVHNFSLQTDQFLSARSYEIQTRLKRLMIECAIMEFDIEILSNPNKPCNQVK